MPAVSARLGALTRTNSEALLGAQAAAVPERAVLARGGDHLVVPSGRRDPHRAGPLRAGQQRDGPARHAAGRRRRARAAADPVPRTGAAPSVRSAALAVDAALERPHDHRAGHADPGQFADRTAHQARPAHHRARTRRAEPDAGFRWGTRRSAGSPTKIGGFPGGTVGDVFDIPMTAHILGGATIGESADDRRRGRLSPGLRLPRPARGRRLGGTGEPRREPVADHHRDGRAGDVAVAEQGRGRSAARRSGADLPAARRSDRSHGAPHVPARRARGPADHRRSPPAGRAEHARGTAGRIGDEPPRRRRIGDGAAPGSGPDGSGVGAGRPFRVKAARAGEAAGVGALEAERRVRRRPGCCRSRPRCGRSPRRCVPVRLAFHELVIAWPAGQGEAERPAVDRAAAGVGHRDVRR